MRLQFSYVTILTASMLATATALASTAINANAPNKHYDINYNNKHIKVKYNGQYYLQAGTFKSVENANEYKLHLTKKSHQPVIVKPSGNYYVVLIGPIHSADEARALNDSDNKPSLVKAPLISNVSNQKPLVIGDKDAALAPVAATNYFEFIGAIGIANLDAGDSYLGVTSSETDKLIQTNDNDWNTVSAQLGIGYVYYLRDAQRYSDQVQWFPSIEPELNVYFLSSNSGIKGEVLRFGDTTFNDLTYKMPFHSNRIMVDGALTVASLKQFSIYAIGGIGNAWNRLSYKDKDKESINGDPCPDQRLSFNTKSTSHFAWEAGGGLSFAFNDMVGLSLEYLYANLGKVKTSASGNIGALTEPLIVPAHFNLDSQSVLLGLHIAF